MSTLYSSVETIPCEEKITRHFVKGNNETGVAPGLYSCPDMVDNDPDALFFFMMKVGNFISGLNMYFSFSPVLFLNLGRGEHDPNDPPPPLN